MGQIVKAISLWEPWASLMFTGAKKWETRGWETKYRGDLLICAAKGGLSQEELKGFLFQPAFQEGLQTLVDKNARVGTRHLLVQRHKLNFGKALCIVNLVDCVSTEYPYLQLGETEDEAKREMAFGDYSLNRFAWKTENLRRIKNPFPVKGKQGFFNVELPDDVEFEVIS